MVWLGSRPIFDSIIVARDAPFVQDWAMCPPLQTELSYSYLNHKGFPKGYWATVPSSKGAMKTVQGKVNLPTVDFIILFLLWIPSLTRKGIHTLDFFFSPKGNERKQAISKQASKQASKMFEVSKPYLFLSGKISEKNSVL